MMQHKAHSSARRSSKEQGFTIIETMIAIAIMSIGILHPARRVCHRRRSNQQRAGESHRPPENA